MKIHLTEGGEGSGNFGHVGRDETNQRGGSLPNSFKGRDDFVEFVNAEENIKSAKEAIRYTENKIKKSRGQLQNPNFKGNKELLERNMQSDKEFIQGRQKYILELEDIFKKGKNKTIGFGEWRVESEEISGKAYKFWTHPTFGKLRISYSPPYYIQRIAASLTVEIKFDSNKFPYRKVWRGGDSREKGYSWLEKFTGIKAP